VDVGGDDLTQHLQQVLSQSNLNVSAHDANVLKEATGMFPHQVKLMGWRELILVG
jgi:hypothetical protein